MDELPTSVATKLTRISGTPTQPFASTSPAKISTIDVLRYIRSTFDDEDVLDSVPLEAAGNPGAWHAYHSHRSATYGFDDDDLGIDPKTAGTASPGGRKPEEWNWEGVWEERVEKGLQGSLAEPILFGTAGGPDELV
jgi:hypothetical protein